MATGTSACIYLRKINRPHILARNEYPLNIVGAGLRQMRLRHSPGRTIYTTRQLTVPPRTSLRPGKSGAAAVPRQPALVRSFFDRPVGLPPAPGIEGGSYPSDTLQANEDGSEPNGSSLAMDDEVDPDEYLEADAEEETLPRVPGFSLQEEYADFDRLVKSKIVFEMVKPKNPSDPQSPLLYTCRLTPSGPGRTFTEQIETSSPLLALVMGRRSVAVQLQQNSLWDPMQELLHMSESGDQGFEKELLFFRASLPHNATFNVTNLKIQDDLMFVFDKEARRELRVVTKRAEATMFHGRKSSKNREAKPSKPMDPEAIAERNRQLENNKRRAENSTNPSYHALRERMGRLPVRKYAKEVVNLINNNTFSLCVADTGSGKSTQIPQLILDDAISRSEGAGCKIMCIQPRRLAVKRLSHRVAEERYEKLGDSVGYSMRFDKYYPKAGGSIEFCTTGILMNMLKGGHEALGSLSHIVLDEVHTRDVDIDLAMMVLKRMVEERISLGLAVPKVTLMSATVDVDLFASYFSLKTPDGNISPVPHIKIPGRSFEVKKHYLEEVIHDITHTLPPQILASLLRDHAATAQFLNNHFKALDTPNQHAGFVPTDTFGELEEMNIASGLITATILSLLSRKKEGSLLAFVPGMKQLEEITMQLKELGPQLGLDFDDPSRFKFIRLHSSLQKEQSELSVKVPKGCQRIILATDIAETSLTIPDVTHVVDSGKQNRMEFNSVDKIHELVPRWVSKSAALQRAGRAGRVQSGDYHFLGSFRRFHALEHTNTAEITRSELELLCLKLRTIVPDRSVSLAELFAQTLEPPCEGRVHLAVKHLQELRALDGEENLTGLGHLIEGLGMESSFGKMVVLGVIFNCLDPMVILASLASAPIFQSHLDPVLRNQVRASRSRYSAGRKAKNDHLRKIAVYTDIKNHFRETQNRLRHEHGSSRGLDSLSKDLDRVTENKIRQRSFELTAEYADKCMLRWDQLKSIDQTGRDIMEKLSRACLVKDQKFSLFCDFGKEEMNRNSNNESLIKALLVHCLSPNLAVKYPGRDGLDIHPGIHINERIRSSNKRETTLFAFGYRYSNQTVPLSIADVTEVRPLSACLLAGKLEPKDNFIVIDDWLQFQLQGESMRPAAIQEDVVEYHEAFNEALQTAIETLSYNAARATSSGDFAKMSKRHQRDHLAFKSLFTRLEDVMDTVVSLETPRKIAVAPKHWSST